MAKLIATKAFVYAGVELAVGDPFDATETDAFVLKNIGNAREQGEGISPVEPPVEPPVERRSKRSGRYNRRDLRVAT